RLEQEVFRQRIVEIRRHIRKQPVDSPLAQEFLAGLPVDAALLLVGHDIAHRLAVACDGDRLAGFRLARQLRELVLCLLDRNGVHMTKVATGSYFVKALTYRS